MSASKESKKGILHALSVDEYHERNKALFAAERIEVDDIKSVKRLKVILFIYKKWITYQVVHMKDKEQFVNANMFDIIENYLHRNYNNELFLNDFRYVVHTNRNVLITDEEDDDKEEEEHDTLCDIDSCFITNRHCRDKAAMTKHNNKRNELFFVDNNTNQTDDDESGKSIAMQQILDTLHHFMFHTIRFDVNKVINKENKMMNDTENDDIDSLCVDDVIKTLGKIIDKRIKCSKRFRGNDGRYNQNNNKFVTNTINESVLTELVDKNTLNDNDNDDNVAVYQSMVYGNDSLLLQKEKEKERVKTHRVIRSLRKCWLNDLFEAMKRYKIDPQIMNDIAVFIEIEAYDSDSFCDDIRNNPYSRIINAFTTKYNNKNSDDTLYTFLLKIVFEKERDSNVYSAGFIYFYWEFYKHNDDEWNVLYLSGNNQPAVEGNKGYKLKEWFIDQKYIDFKDELLNNKTSSFSYAQYQDTFITAIQKRDNWMKDPNAPKLECSFYIRTWSERCYGIKTKDLIQIKHIMALLFYCNFSNQSFSFSSTFRRNNLYESDASLKQRHSEFYFWGKHLRECVQCFGTMMAYSTIPIFYHGVSKRMLFDSTSIQLNGPLSTTRDFIIAYTIFGSNGVVIDIKNDNSATMYFDANFWSSYTSEDEKFYLSGINPLIFINIHDITNQIHYEIFITLINICDRIFKGYPLFGIKPSRSIRSLLKRVFIDEMNECYLEKPYSSEIPQYFAFLFHQFIKQITEVQINLEHWNTHFRYHDKRGKCDVYGFKKLRALFICSDDETFKYSAIIKLCHNLESLTVYNISNSYMGFTASISLNNGFLSEILECIKIRDETPQSLFNRFQFVKPCDDIYDFITKYSKLFLSKGWILKQMEYSNDKRGKDNREASLVIEKVNIKE